MKKLMELLREKKEVIAYLFFGVCTTAVNIIVYAAAARVFGIAPVPATVIAWVIAVLFAYITNRIWVFESRASGAAEIFNEFCRFIGCRLLSGGVDVACMWLFVDVMGLPDLLIKTGANVLVIVMNYVASRFWIFK